MLLALLALLSAHAQAPYEPTYGWENEWRGPTTLVTGAVGLYGAPIGVSGLAATSAIYLSYLVGADPELISMLTTTGFSASATLIGTHALFNEKAQRARMRDKLVRVLSDYCQTHSECKVGIESKGYFLTLLQGQSEIRIELGADPTRRRNQIRPAHPF